MKNVDCAKAGAGMDSATNKLDSTANKLDSAINKIDSTANKLDSTANNPADLDFYAIVSEVLEIECDALLQAKSRIDAIEFRKIIDLIYSANRLIVVGVGKSGLIGAKIAATLSSTGTPSIFMHPTEAMHGDLGGILREDAVLAISYSGESEELVALMPHLRRLSRGIITMTKHKNSSISAQGDFFIDISVRKEACPLNVAPTASTTLTLALGDALAVCLMKKRNFGKENFANFHPGGSLGRRLFVKVKDLMQCENLPIITKNTSLKDAIIAITKGKIGNVLIVESSVESNADSNVDSNADSAPFFAESSVESTADSAPFFVESGVDSNAKSVKYGKLLAVLSDGDLRRAMMREDFSLESRAIDFATRTPKVCDNAEILAYDALKIIEDLKIQMLVVVDEGAEIVGVIHIHKLIEAGIG